MTTKQLEGKIRKEKTINIRHSLNSKSENMELNKLGLILCIHFAVNFPMLSIYYDIIFLHDKKSE